MTSGFGPGVFLFLEAPFFFIGVMSLAKEHYAMADKTCPKCPNSPAMKPQRFLSDLTGIFCTRRNEREFTWRKTGHADEEIQAGADREFAAAD
jgi:hypothetical protein